MAASAVPPGHSPLPTVDVREVDGWDDDEDDIASTVPPKGAVPGADDEDFWQGGWEETVFIPDEGLVAERRSHDDRRRALLSCTRGDLGVVSIQMQDLKTLVTWQHEARSRQGAATSTVSGACLTWERGEVLGTGSMGSVFKALDQRTGKIVAVKEVPLSASNGHAQDYRKQLETEIAICKELNDPHIVSYLGFDYVEENFYIYLEYMPGGAMSQVLSQFGAFEECLIAHYGRDVLCGLQYLHSRHPRPVVHRDIKAANVLVGLDSRAKLADFGCSKMDALTFTKGLKGSIPWMAPEVILGKGYGRKADIWSYGCLLVEMSSAQHPWGKLDNPMAAMRKVGMSKDLPEFPSGFSERCRAFVYRSLNRDAKERPKAAELLRDEFMTSLPPEHDFS